MGYIQAQLFSRAMAPSCLHTLDAVTSVQPLGEDASHGAVVSTALVTCSWAPGHTRVLPAIYEVTVGVFAHFSFSWLPFFLLIFKVLLLSRELPAHAVPNHGVLQKLLRVSLWKRTPSSPPGVIEAGMRGTMERKRQGSCLKNAWSFVQYLLADCGGCEGCIRSSREGYSREMETQGRARCGAWEHEKS
jgi:hypothetical protein